MKSIYYSCFLLGIFFSHAQQGDYYMSHYVPEVEVSEYSIFDLKTDQNGLLWIATSKGLMSFDGSDWEYYQTPSAAVSIEISDQNDILVGCIGEVGRVGVVGGILKYQKLAESDSVSDIFFDTFSFDGSVFFMGSYTLIEFSGDENINSFYDDYLSGYVSKEGLVIRSLEDDYLFNGDDKSRQVDTDVLFKIGDSGDGLYVNEEGDLVKNSVKLPQSERMKDLRMFPTDGKLIGDSLVVLSTMHSGLVFVSTLDASYFEIIDYFSGLPDNEIYDVFVDDDDAVWVAHVFGISRIYPSFPAYNFSNFPNLRGNVISASKIDDVLWVSTSVGVFYLDVDSVFSTKVYYEEKKKTPQSSVSPPKTEEKTTKKSLSNRLFNKKQRAKETDMEPKKAKNGPGFFKKVGSKLDDMFVMESQNDRLIGKKKNAKDYVRKERKTLQKVTYTYVQVSGANGKFDRIVPFGDKILAVGSTGIFEVDENTSTHVIEESVKLFAVPDEDQMLIYNYSDQLILLELFENTWVELWRQEIDDVLLQLYLDDNSALWAAAAENMYKMNFNDSTLNVEMEYPIPNQSLEKVSIIKSEGIFRFVNSKGWFVLDESKGQFKPDDENNTIVGESISYLTDMLGDVWVYNGKTWYSLDQENRLTNYEYLSLFPDISFFGHRANSSEYWLVTGDNRLLSLDMSKNANLKQAKNLFVKKVNSSAKSFKSTSDFILKYDENNLTVNVSYPDYSGLLKPVFRYKLEGLNDEWSDWTSSNVIDFTFLPPGGYSLKVSSRDNFGRTSEEELLNFKVETPYWETPWFYALQVLFFSGLVVVSTRLNQSKKGNQLLSEGLTVLTIIIIIEFLQSVIASYFEVKSSPVVSFAIDAFVALCIFPLERFLRTFIKEGKASVKVPVIKTKNATN